LNEIVEDGVTGFVVGPSAEALAGAIIRAAESPTLQNQVKAALPDLQQKFGVNVREQYLQLYRDVIARRPVGPQETVV
jgi:glycosyltransferase involved in cell wall biosynthesis